jgi:hypothetical protein
MCRYGTVADVEITISTGERVNRRIDSCIVPLVKALTEGGILMDSSCCGHGKTDGHISLMDGRMLIIKNGE